MGTEDIFLTQLLVLDSLTDNNNAQLTCYLPT